MWPILHGCAPSRMHAATKLRPIPGTHKSCPATDRSSTPLRCLMMSSPPNANSYEISAESTKTPSGSARSGAGTSGQGRQLGHHQVHKTPYRLDGEGDRPTGCRVPDGAGEDLTLGRTGCSVPQCAGYRLSDFGHYGSLSARTGHWDSKVLSSLVGLAPWSRDSGSKRGKRAIRGGRSTVRSALYLCA